LRIASIRYHVTPDQSTPLPPHDTLPVVEADEPFDALATAGKLAREGLLPSEPRTRSWVRFIIGHNEGRIHVAQVPLTVQANIPVDWR
jgi:hypothetical protein